MALLGKKGRGAVGRGLVGDRDAVQGELVAPAVKNDERQVEVLEQGVLVVADHLRGEQDDAGVGILRELCHGVLARGGVREVERSHGRLERERLGAALYPRVDAGVEGAHVNDAPRDTCDGEDDALELVCTVVAHALHGVEDDARRLGAHVALLVQDVRDGGGGVSSGRGYVPDADSAHLSPNPAHHGQSRARSRRLVNASVVFVYLH